MASSALLRQSCAFRTNASGIRIQTRLHRAKLYTRLCDKTTTAMEAAKVDLIESILNAWPKDCAYMGVFKDVVVEEGIKCFYVSAEVIFLPDVEIVEKKYSEYMDSLLSEAKDIILRCVFQDGDIEEAKQAAVHIHEDMEIMLASCYGKQP